MPLRHHSLDDIGNKHATPGSRDWASYVRLQIQGERHDLDRTIQQCKGWLESFQRYDGWKTLHARNGSAFLSFSDFCEHPEPEGLGTPYPIVNAILAEHDTTKTLRDVMAAAPELAKHGVIGRGRDRVDNVKSKGGNSDTYLAARLKRDRPDIAERVMAGEFPSMRAAALEAGIVKPRLQVPADIEAMATYLRGRLTSDQCRRLAALLTDGNA